jgi:hypothetical protein
LVNSTAESFFDFRASRASARERCVRSDIESLYIIEASGEIWRAAYSTTLGTTKK